MANLGKSVKGKSTLAKKQAKEVKVLGKAKVMQQSDTAKAQAKLQRRMMMVSVGQVRSCVPFHICSLSPFPPRRTCSTARRKCRS